MKTLALISIIIIHKAGGLTDVEACVVFLPEQEDYEGQEGNKGAMASCILCSNEDGILGGSEQTGFSVGDSAHEKAVADGSADHKENDEGAVDESNWGNI